MADLRPEIDLDPIFGVTYHSFETSQGVMVMPKQEPRYLLTDEAVSKLNEGHEISDSKRRKLQQIVRIKHKHDPIGAQAEIKLSHL